MQASFLVDSHSTPKTVEFLGVLFSICWLPWLEISNDFKPKAVKYRELVYHTVVDQGDLQSNSSKAQAFLKPSWWQEQRNKVTRTL